jgi:hypothetical protein
MMQQRLNASARPPKGFRILVEKGALPFWEGLGDVDFLCDQVLQVIAVADPIRLGYRIRANIGLGVRPGMIDQAASALAASPDTHHIVITTGSFDLLCTTFLKTQDDLSSFVREYLGTVPGVVSHEVMVLMKVTKDNLGADWGFRTQSSVPSA